MDKNSNDTITLKNGILHIKPKIVYIFRGNIPQKI